MAVSRREAIAKRMKRRKDLGLPVGRPRRDPTAGHTVELDLSGLDGETVATAKEQEYERHGAEIALRIAEFKKETKRRRANVKEEIKQAFREDFKRRRAALQQTLAGLKHARARAKIEARGFRQLGLRLGALIARSRGANASTPARDCGERWVDRIRAYIAPLPTGQRVTAVEVAKALDGDLKTVAVVLGSLARAGEAKKLEPGIYQVRKPKGGKAPA